MIIRIIELDNIQDFSKQFQKYFDERTLDPFTGNVLLKIISSIDTDCLAKGNNRKVTFLVLTPSKSDKNYYKSSCYIAV